ncbi:hypothetical protein O3P69_005885 [Scylla paramamosain]|uniref:Uncharacterized protein n=1 Tax=Scylla paramamosain TaxID=85552 RepID=A0AAW0U5M5_SCYPA
MTSVEVIGKFAVQPHIQLHRRLQPVVFLQPLPAPQPADAPHLAFAPNSAAPPHPAAPSQPAAAPNPVAAPCPTAASKASRRHKPPAKFCMVHIDPSAPQQGWYQHGAPLHPQEVVA